MAAVSSVNLIIHKGTDFEETFSLDADDGLGLNLTGYTAKCSLRKHPKSTKAFPFNVEITVSDSSVKVSMASTVTSTLPSGRCYYDLTLISPAPTSNISKTVEGNVIVEDTSSV